MAKASAMQKALLGGCLAMVAGYTDSVSIQLHKAYASMMTGNMIAIAVFAVQPGVWVENEENNMLPSPVFVALLILFNMCGVFTYYLAEHAHKYGTTFIAPVGAIVITAMAVATYNEVHIPKRMELWPLTFIFGIQNAMSTAGTVGVPTTLLTGHLGNMATALQQIAAGKRDKACVAKNAISLTIIIFFFSGALLGAWATEVSKGTKFADFILVPATIFLAVFMVIDDSLSTESEAAPAPTTISATDSERAGLVASSGRN